MLTSLLAAIAAIPKLISAIESLTAMMKKADDEKWFAHNTDAFEKLRNAKTEQEMFDAAKAIQDSIRHL